jgi:hypothetical protein
LIDKLVGRRSYGSGLYRSFSSDNHYRARNKASSPCDIAATSADRSEPRIMGDALSLPSLCTVATCDTHGSVSTRKKSLDASCNLSPLGSECSLPFTGRHPDSSSRHGRFKEHQSPRPSSSPGCCPWRLHRPTRFPKPFRKPSFGLWRGLRHRTAPTYFYSVFTFVPEEVKHMER